MAPSLASPRIALFTHDTLGLGHLRRCRHIVRALAEHAPQAALLLLSGSPALHVFEDLPPNADYVKIPTIVKTGTPGAQLSHLPVGVAEVSLLRARLVQQTLRGFTPDVFLVDNFPLGTLRELLPSLQEARRLSTRLVLGLRDIVDSPEKVRTDWARQGMYEILDRYYDRILVYGVQEVFDVVDAYALPPAIAAKVHYCGYVTAPAAPPRSPAEVRAKLGIPGPFILVSGGGGGDGFPLLQAFLHALPLLPSIAAVVVTGPLMSAADHAELAAQATGQPGVILLKSVRNLPSYMAAADLVVTMCGYNTAAEILALRPRAVVVPRTWQYGEHRARARASEEGEQNLRAQALARCGLVELLDPQELTSQRLAERIATVLARPRTESQVPFQMQGLANVTHHLLTLAATQEGVAGVRP
jgi:predicted glycosyltransferase